MAINFVIGDLDPSGIRVPGLTGGNVTLFEKK